MDVKSVGRLAFTILVITQKFINVNCADSL